MTWEEIKASVEGGHIDWKQFFDERQLKQIKWSQLYAGDEFRHGDDGHNAKLIIAKMAELLDQISENITVEILK